MKKKKNYLTLILLFILMLIVSILIFSNVFYPILQHNAQLDTIYNRVLNKNQYTAGEGIKEFNFSDQYYIVDAYNQKGEHVTICVDRNMLTRFEINNKKINYEKVKSIISLDYSLNNNYEIVIGYNGKRPLYEAKVRLDDGIVYYYIDFHTFEVIDKIEIKK